VDNVKRDGEEVEWWRFGTRRAERQRTIDEAPGFASATRRKRMGRDQSMQLRMRRYKSEV
jgi:hypothetical protein